jgi:hypothetical protein
MASRKLSGRKVVLAGLFSAKDEDPTAEIESLGRSITKEGGIVVGQIVQRRGVSRDKRPGGAQRMDRPMSSATLIGEGKALELASLCRNTGADLVVFRNALTEKQRENLRNICGTEVQDGVALGLPPVDPKR